MANWDSYYNLGIQTEQNFAQQLISVYGGTIQHSTPAEDINDHIDLIWTKNHKLWTFDVKGLKKNNRIDNIYDDSIHWIELRNVLGKPGWLFGNAHYIVFETNLEWVIVNRKQLISWLNTKIIDKTIKTTKNFYEIYSRKGRKDAITKIYTNDLKQIACKIIIK